MKRFILYAFIVSAHRHGILVHAFCTMSTHMHYVITDRKGNLPRFLEMFHRLVAIGVKILRKWDGAVWDRSQTSVVALCTRQAIVEKIAYTLANPVEANLVRRAHEWPGAKTVVNDIGNSAIHAERPDEYFRSENPDWVPNAELLVCLPPSIADTDAKAFRDDVDAELTKIETAVHTANPKRRVLGPKRAAMVRPESRITTHELIRQRNPTFAVGRGDTDEIQEAAIAALRAFQTAYGEALKKWRAGDRSVVFPAGTYAMRVLHGANVAPQ